MDGFVLAGKLYWADVIIEAIHVSELDGAFTPKKLLKRLR